jgi:hypothetical protein
MTIRWMSLWDPVNERKRSCFHGGCETRAVVITGIDSKTLGSCPLVFEAPPGVEVFEIPAGENPRDAARRMRGALFIAPKVWQP